MEQYLNRDNLTTSLEMKKDEKEMYLGKLTSHLYTLVIVGDLEENQFRILSSKDFYKKYIPSSGSFEELISNQTKLIHENWSINYWQNFNPENLCKTLLDDKKQIYMEYLQKNEDGQYDWYSSKAFLIQSETGKKDVAFMISPIYMKKEKEQETESINVAISELYDECFVLDTETETFTILRCNKSIEKLPKRGIYDEMLLEYTKQLIHEDDKKLFYEFFCCHGIKQQLNSEQRFVSKKFRRLSDSGDYRWIEMLGILVNGKNKNLVIITYRDIHDLSIAKWEQKAADRRFANAVDNLYSAIYEGDLLNNKLYLWKTNNGELERIPEGYSLDAHCKDVLENLIHPDYQKEYACICGLEQLKNLLQGDVTEIYREVPRKIGDGSYHWYSTQVQVLIHDEKQFQIMFYLKDLEQVKKDEEKKQTALRDALYLAEQANNAKTEFLSHMSHDIRTPLNAVIGMTTIARAYTGNEDKIKECLDKITISAKYLLSLINDILDMSKIESGKVTLNEEVFSMKEIIENITTVTSAQIEEKQQKFEARIREDVQEFYIGDVVRMNQILMNLLNNAIKFTPQNGTISFIVTSVKQSNDEMFIRFEIKDTGIGMSEEFMQRAFDPFVQASDSKGKVLEGTGLGLPIARNLVHLMGGHISVSSIADKGSTFFVELPFKVTEKKEIIKKENGVLEEKECKTNLPKGLKILVAEDNDINLEIIQTLLEMEGFIVESAENGEAVLEKFETSEINYYDLIFMDIRMPFMDGLEATRRIRACKKVDAKTIPIVAMTANAFTEDIHAAKKAGMDGYLVKPLDMSLVLKKMEEVLKKKEDANYERDIKSF